VDFSVAAGQNGRMTIRAFLAAALLLLLLPCAAFAEPAASDRLARRAADAVEVLKGARPAAEVFDDRFLAEVPPEQLAALARQLQAQNGAIVATEDVQAEGTSAASFRIRFAHAVATAHLALDAAPPFKVAGFRITSVSPLDDSPQKIAADFAALPGRSGFGVFRLGDGAPSAIVGARANEQFAIGSAFKLWVLDALAEEIAAGRHRWDEVVRLGSRSLPSGMTQDWPPDAPVTVETLATLMISISDNTATDTLIRLVGRDRMAARVRATGHSDPSRMLPFLTTAESFALKLSPPSLREAYARADDAVQARMLAQLDVRKVLDTAELNRLNGSPTAIDAIEWFASPKDLARVLDSLRRRQDARVLAILGVADHLPKELDERFAYVGYKGGSEVGVIDLTWLLRRKSGEWVVVTASWNDPEAAVDNRRFELLALRLLHLAAQDQGS
jgi:beta-lactamase class A